MCVHVFFLDSGQYMPCRTMQKHKYITIAKHSAKLADATDGTQARTPLCPVMEADVGNHHVGISGELDYLFDTLKSY